MMYELLMQMVSLDLFIGPFRRYFMEPTKVGNNALQRSSARTAAKLR